jgi:F0F1-type ATP synthase, gamma subunit
LYCVDEVVVEDVYFVEVFCQEVVEYCYLLLICRDMVRRVGVVVIIIDKGLCGGLNTNLLCLVFN